MKIQIRRNTFETNSSSMHSLVVMKKNSYAATHVEEDSIYVNKEGKYRISNDEDLDFERYPFEILSKPSAKFRYLIACYAYDEEKREEVIEAFKTLHPEIKEITFPKDYYSENEYYYGSIDHQSVGIVTDFINKNGISFVDFLSNPRFKIIVDGDEYCKWQEAKESGLIRTEDIEYDYIENDHDFSLYDEEER